MLNWWLGKGGDSHHQDESELDPPETPAPVFAARALKSAIFGTPAPPPGDDTLYEIKQHEASIPKVATSDAQTNNMSPTKPPGILLTPGTATSRRKTVSFGNEVAGKEDGLVGCRALALKKIKKSDEFVDQGEGRTLEEDSTRRALRKTSLTKTLQSAREGKSKTEKNADRKPIKTSPRKSTYSRKIELDLVEPTNNADGNITTDLNEPQSESGRYWKSQYQSYHDDARAEMQLLLRYKYLAKGYAKKKDSEAIDLAEKLKEEQLKVIEKEAEITKLSAQISNPESEGGNDEESLELIKEVARQRALVSHYKAQVEEFRVALEEPEGLRRAEKTQSKTGDGRLKFDSNSRELARLETELESVRKLMAAAERRNQRLQEDNTRLAQELLHAELALEKQREKSDQRKQNHDEQMRIKDEKIDALQHEYNAIKDLAKRDRQKAEQLLDKRYNQIRDLRKDLDSMRGSETASKQLEKDLEQKSREHERIVADLRRQLANVNIQGGLSAYEGDTLPEKNMSNMPRRKTAFPTDDCPSQERFLPVSMQRNPRSLRNNKSSFDELPTGVPRTSQLPLTEIVNNASVDTIPPTTSGPVQYTPLANRFSDMTFDSPALDLSSMQPSFSQNLGRNQNQRQSLPSPRPSMFNIPSSPPQPVKARPRLAGRQRSNNDIGGRQMNLASSSLESSRVRRNLSPARAAAARARLEEKNAAKKKGQGRKAQKMNIVN
ncbi:hypothetical protein HYALB_00004431 [Hymenoscyphus albidus]|uniref:Spindle pole body-associated protein cut12 domain-containing protein n=1 Tax=Hymenoscyphus albidus TaxID=595503 RepID=A0A9N9LLF0_9HELO|nr:hypothetical protein HYALB_00004431 [Hymenoscyphus albidus]